MQKGFHISSDRAMLHGSPLAYWECQPDVQTDEVLRIVLKSLSMCRNKTRFFNCNNSIPVQPLALESFDRQSF